MVKDKIFALVDCNNFYVSCERVFDLTLKNYPTIVLSNNDGCVISRSQEVKDLGIKMGIPVFKCRELIDKYKVKLRSSNFPLYGDMSSRVIQSLRKFSPFLEIYSVDESFLGLENLKIKDLDSYASKIRSKVLIDTGIPVSVGIAKTKTLAKVANYITKKNQLPEGIFNLLNKTETEIDEILKLVDIEDIWGVGRKTAPFLQERGIFNAYQLKYSDEKWIRKNLSVIGERTVLELRGISCYLLDTNPEEKKGIMSSRSFGRYVYSFEELSEAISVYTARAVEKLREQNSLASFVGVYIQTNRHKKNIIQYRNSNTVGLLKPNSYLPEINKQAVNALKTIYKSGFAYNKAGVYLSGLTRSGNLSTQLFEDKNTMETEKRNNKLMTTFDNINKKWGSRSVFLLSEGLNQKWKALSQNRSPRFTTDWKELLIVKAK